jgi:hypothetical protein
MLISSSFVELCLPYEAKSIKPQPIGGIAGGDKAKYTFYIMIFAIFD